MERVTHLRPFKQGCQADRWSMEMLNELESDNLDTQTSNQAFMFPSINGFAPSFIQISGGTSSMYPCDLRNST